MKAITSILAAVALTVGVASSASATVFTYTSSGTISGDYSDSYDYSGIFGGGSLFGKSFTLTTSFDTNNNYGNESYPNQYSNSYGYAPISVSVNVDGHSYSTTITNNNWGQGYIANGLSAGNVAGYYLDEVYTYGYGNANDGSYIQMQQYAYDYWDAFVGSSNSLDISRTIDPSNFYVNYAYFYLSDPTAGSTYFNTYGGTAYGVSSGIQSIVINGGNVPEPETLALFGIGLLGFVATRRRAKKQAA
ncbi:PEP-CTERM protein-sorting domain-containing protein [Noviherbaspirillum humi]|uniref:PEP-CTERM protein-sorting domain-containing protein n=1 Tax=Noviherbaspirillum humi TaxID=1688639 RepID=A0A239LVS9_9BURK|nr:PEP-CTERM sorting domain-containing protein [Noviherbaspirillum humi]SNT33913.1 PEP-CTERM protein-sorting domain-containing protein [Noviherbaspirillum humi]